MIFAGIARSLRAAPGGACFDARGRSIDAGGSPVGPQNCKLSSLRGLLLHAQPAVRAARAAAVRDVPPLPPGGAAPATADALRVPHGAAHARGLGLPERAGAG